MSRPFDSIDCAHRRPARYDDRTSGPGEHAEEADPLGLLLELDELVGLDPAVDGQVPRRRTQVLRDRDDVGAGVVQILQRLHDLFAALRPCRG